MTSLIDNSDNPLPNLELAFLKEGDQDHLVTQLQIRLALLDYYSDEITGHFDASTKAALQALQRQHYLSEDGYFDLETWYAMNVLVNEIQFPSTQQRFETQFPSVQRILGNCMTWLGDILSQRQRFIHPASCKSY